MITVFQVEVGLRNGDHFHELFDTLIRAINWTDKYQESPRVEHITITRLIVGNGTTLTRLYNIR